MELGRAATRANLDGFNIPTEGSPRRDQLSPTNAANRLPTRDVDLETSDVPLAQGDLDKRQSKNWRIWYKRAFSDEKYVLGWAGMRRDLDNTPCIRWGNGTPSTGGPNASMTVAVYNTMHGSLILEYDPVEDDYEREKERMNEGFSDNLSPVGLLPQDRFADAKAAREAKEKEHREAARPKRKGAGGLTNELQPAKKAAVSPLDKSASALTSAAAPSSSTSVGTTLSKTTAEPRGQAAATTSSSTGAAKVTKTPSKAPGNFTAPRSTRSEAVQQGTSQRSQSPRRAAEQAKALAQAKKDGNVRVATKAAKTKGILDVDDIVDVKVSFKHRSKVGDMIILGQITEMCGRNTYRVLTAAGILKQKITRNELLYRGDRSPDLLAIPDNLKKLPHISEKHALELICPMRLAQSVFCKCANVSCLTPSALYIAVPRMNCPFLMKNGGSCKLKPLRCECRKAGLACNSR